MLNCPQADVEFMRPGSWLQTGSGLLFFCCPACGSVGLLRDYTIDDEGHVDPQYRCITSWCDFHDVLHLEGWKTPPPTE